MSAERYSSNFTLFYRIFFPVFWFIFFGACVFLFFIVPIWNDEIDIYGFTKYIYLALFILGILIYFLFAIRQLRVDADDEYLYVTNYIKTVRIPLGLIEMVSFKDYYVIRLVQIKLKQKGHFGKVIHLIERENQFERYCLQHSIPIKTITAATQKMLER